MIVAAVAGSVVAGTVMAMVVAVSPGGFLNPTSMLLASSFQDIHCIIYSGQYEEKTDQPPTLGRLFDTVGKQKLRIFIQ